MKIDQSLTTPDAGTELDRLSFASNSLGCGIVSIAGILENLQTQSKEQLVALQALQIGSNDVVEAKDNAMIDIAKIADKAKETLDSVQVSVNTIAETSEHSVDLAGWVRSVQEKSSAVEDILSEVRKSNDQIASIAAQVNVLAMNAKIEAARAGVAGKGFAIVAEAINDLSQKTTVAAEEISSSIQNMANWMSQLQQGAEISAQRATTFLERNEETDAALSSIENLVSETHITTESIYGKMQIADQAIDRFVPSISQIDASIRQFNEDVKQTSDQVDSLINTSESIAQGSINLGEENSDLKQTVLLVQDLAGRIETVFENGLLRGRIVFEDLFDTNYEVVPGSDPEQTVTRFTKFTDGVLPSIQDPVLETDSRIAFCVTVDRNGYLPTHNARFSKRQSRDPIWNAENCKNRHLSTDRISLKAGKNEAPFLMQTFQKKTGGGRSTYMKDVSAPIKVQGRHWGAVRVVISL
jgi:methyl-accepting chemotaxis protein